LALRLIKSIAIELGADTTHPRFGFTCLRTVSPNPVM